MWVKVLENFCSNVGYKGKIEDIADKDLMEEQLLKFVYTMKKQNGDEYHVSSIR